MKSMWKVCLMVALMAVVSNVKADILFSDSYNRPNSNDIDSSQVGMSGTLSPLTYNEAYQGSGDGSITILDEQLQVAQGSGMGSMYIEHNFTDSSIVSAGGFSVSLDVVSITSADDPGNRYGGFGVGNTLAEAQAAADSFDNPATSFRPALHLQGAAVSDFYVDLALDQTLRVWDNGNVVSAINVGAVSGTIRVDFLVPDFNAGSSVTAKVYFNGTLQDTQSFTWDNADSNYIGISGRTGGAGVIFDNLEIAMVPEPATMILLGLGGLFLRRK